MSRDEETAALSQPSRSPYLLGVYLAVNAVSDAAVVVDGPDCAFFKAEHVHGKHDLGSRLLDVMGNHRVLVSMTTTDNVSTSRGEGVRGCVEAIAADPSVGLVIVTALPMASIIGLQYDKLVRDLRPLVRPALVAVPGRSLQGDWLSGYEDVLVSLAEEVRPDGGPVDPGSVSVIGNLMDRNEQDHLGNVAELTRMIEGIGLHVDSVWLSGVPWPRLERAGRSGTLVALPMGRAAAEVIARRTGAMVLPVDTPFGLAGTVGLVRALGEATGRVAAASRFIEAELAVIAARLEWAVPHFFAGRRLAFCGTPDLVPGIVDICDELGMIAMEIRSPCLPPRWYRPVDGLPSQPVFDAPFGTGAWDGARRPDLVIGSHLSLRHVPSDLPVVELGYPCYADHALVDRPFLGFRGYLCFLQRILTAVSTWRGGLRGGR